MRKLIVGAVLAAVAVTGITLAAPAAMAAEAAPAAAVQQQPPPPPPPGGGVTGPTVLPGGMIVMTLNRSFQTFEDCAAQAQAAVDAAGYGGFSWFCTTVLPPFKVNIMIGFAG